ncbi:outer membrane beta-barrel protein [Psittacicella hinzii]|uniref:Outer membrane protein beta-barrel domain-containing protein n=1 Tax=Psittacicella hinzii TaxID=2028575 RepID=A0A3A1YNS6_9GAMM|nr:outer membrane beta-barrel protein [Psittacicella hinzii]RIY39136.1 hypothetical protein CKF58_02805 [Psittacicella hinzii]
MKKLLVATTVLAASLFAATNAQARTDAFLFEGQVGFKTSELTSSKNLKGYTFGLGALYKVYANPNVTLYTGGEFYYSALKRDDDRKSTIEYTLTSKQKNYDLGVKARAYFLPQNNVKPFVGLAAGYNKTTSKFLLDSSLGTSRYRSSSNRPYVAVEAGFDFAKFNVLARYERTGYKVNIDNNRVSRGVNQLSLLAGVSY